MVFPDPTGQSEVAEKESILVVKECYCPNGHLLNSSRAVFNDFSGIILKVKNKDGKIGKIALSPICGDKSRVAIDIDIEKNEVLEVFCPECDVKLPIYSPCSCGGELTTLFSDQSKDYTNCIGICNRVGCRNAEIKVNNELFTCSDAQSRKEGRWR